MEKIHNNILFIVAVIIITISLIYLLPLTGYLKSVESDDIVGFQPIFILVFLVFNLIFIGIFASIHWLYVKDYSTIKSIWFFSIFGGITGAMLGEGGNVVMIIPYTILMFIYAQLYKRFSWWKVASTSYLAGIIVENIINRSPIQIPTLMWIAFFVYPYFATKIWENRKKISIISIIKDFKWSFLFSIILIALEIYFSRNNISPPLIILGATLPFIISTIYKIFRKQSKKK